MKRADPIDVVESVKDAGQQVSQEMAVIFNVSLDLIGVANLAGFFTRVNPSFERILGYTEGEFLSRPLLDFVYEADVPKTRAALRSAAVVRGQVYIVNRCVCKNGSLRWIEWRVVASGIGDKFIGVGRDITERLDAQKKIKAYSDNLETLVKKRTRELNSQKRKLKEVNTALNLIVKRSETDKVNYQEQVVSNVARLVRPHLKKLLKSGLSPAQAALVEIVASSLQEITQPSALRLSSAYIGLTPAELRVAELIRRGKNSKTIAEILNLSHKTIEVHRDRIREKLNIKKTKINLQSYLRSLEHSSGQEYRPI